MMFEHDSMFMLKCYYIDQINNELFKWILVLLDSGKEIENDWV